MKNNIFTLTAIIAVSLAVTLSVNYFIFAWTPPDADPPNGTIPVLPLGVSACGDCNATFVNETQANSINSSMITNGTVSSADIADSTVTGADIANNTVTSADTDAATVQDRVSGTCAAGSSIRVINANGTVACENDSVGSGCNWAGESCSAWQNIGVTSYTTESCNTSIATCITCTSNVVTSFRSAIQKTGCIRYSCFTAGTKVLLFNGDYENIENIEIGDKLASADGYNTVLDFDRPLLTKEKEQWLMSINGGDYFITDNHPVMTTEGWKAYNPESAVTEAWDVLYGNISKLEIGDEIVLAHGKLLKVESISIKEEKDKPIKLYNFVLDGDYTYYANDMLVMGFVPDKAGRFPIEHEH